MNSLIEQAAQRLEQLRQAGVDTPPTAPAAPTVLTAAAHVELLMSNVLEFQSLPLSRRVEIDFEALAVSGVVSPNDPRSQVADQFRVIKRPLIRNAMGKGASVIPNGNLIMVTSAWPGEGKTFTAINLAMSIATELDHTVMLVDADVSRPSVMRSLGLTDGLGLLDLVLDSTQNVSSMLLRTNIEKLTLLPSGTAHPRATELLASDAMAQLLKDMAMRYPDRIIIFDSPPLLAATEARVLASHMGQIVVVVQAEKTLRSDVQQALATIDLCPVILLLLNQAREVAKSGYEYRYEQRQT
jgi:protein-tyrosine kinase